MDGVETVVRWTGAAVVLTAWIVAGRGAARASRRPAGRGAGLAPRLGALTTYLVGAIPLTAVAVVLWRPLPLDPSEAVRGLLLVVGSIVGGAGAALYLAAHRGLGDMYNVSSSLGSELFADHRLVTSGVYARVRHPMYLGLVLGAVGALLVYRTWTTVLALSSMAGVRIKARHEDRLLEKAFGTEYRDYRDRVPGWIPAVRRADLLRARPLPGGRDRRQGGG